jgi:hypothetical protein
MSQTCPEDSKSGKACQADQPARPMVKDNEPQNH